MTIKELLEDLLIEFDELDMQPMLIVPNPTERAKEWKHELTYAIRHLKAEVAREIFEEIEKKVKSSLTIHLEEINKEHIKDTPLYDRHSGIIFALKGMDDFITELKKKYTEGE